MSKIEKELVDATEVSAKRGEKRQEFLTRLVKAANDLPDAKFNALSEKADAWINSAFDAMEAKPPKDIPDFPDAEPEEPEETTARRQRGGSKAAEPAEPKKGDTVKVVTKRGKEVEGEVLEIDDELLVLGYGKDGEEEFARNRLESITVVGGGEETEEEQGSDGEPELKVGMEVEVTTKRGKVIKGKVTELDGDVVVVGDEELQQSRIESIKVIGGKAAPKEETSGRRTRSSGKEEAAPSGKAPRVANKDKEVSLGMRLRQLCASGYKEDGKLPTTDAIRKQLEKEGYEVKDNTLSLNFAEAKKMFDIFEEHGLLK